MRPDMSKVLVERPRKGGSTKWKNRFRMKGNDDDGYVPTSMRKVHRDRKELNENLNPLIRFLSTKVGHSWDDVYSEICQVCKKTTAVQYHVFQHLWQLVSVNVHIDENGIVYSSDKNYRIYSDSSPSFYVDPVNGTLKLAPKASKFPYSKYRHAQPAVQIVKKDKKCFVRHDGIWYEVTFENFSSVNGGFREKVMVTPEWIGISTSMIACLRNMWVSILFGLGMVNKFVR